MVLLLRHQSIIVQFLLSTRRWRGLINGCCLGTDSHLQTTGSAACVPAAKSVLNLSLIDDCHSPQLIDDMLPSVFHSIVFDFRQFILVTSALQYGTACSWDFRWTLRVSLTMWLLPRDVTLARYMLCRMVLYFRWPWVIPNYPKPPHFLHFVSPFMS